MLDTFYTFTIVMGEQGEGRADLNAVLINLKNGTFEMWTE